MEYLIEILPSLINGALITLEVFFLVLVLSIPLGVVIAFIMRFNIKLLNYFINIYMDYAWDAVVTTIDFYLLCITICGNTIR